MEYKQFRFYCQTGNIGAIGDGLSELPAGEKPEYILAVLQTSLRPDVLEYLGTEMIGLPPEQGTSLLAELLYSDEAASRNLAIELFPAFGHAALATLKSHIDDMDPDVRIFTVLALQQLPFREDVLKTLVDQLPSEKDPNVLAALIEALGDLGGQEEAKAIAEAMAHFDHPHLRFIAERALTRLDDTRQAEAGGIS
jgi:HEAT repeat protein